ncbi:MAG: RDD family protein [Chloroherpetonaceae bacterium]|nr:RDD family protein [Chloroherpetonaceae bacterium]MCS7212523.1 RDD family protein [Chloroherpetonaceae bacterium]MDW8019035.1 RDD family protein [Chloroherpetonaceae bacterium]MDW8466108.1 RDD family protein [Chloroherpetonaceae bacterium]
MHTVKVQTTQNVEISYEVASVSDRILAAIVDGCIIIAYFITVSTVLYVLSEIGLDLGNSVGIIILFGLYIVALFYDLLCEVFMDGQSFGKKAMKIKVVKIDGTEPSIGSYFLRWILRIVDIILFTPAVAILAILINGKGQRIGDIAANTTVVKLTERVKLKDTIFEAVDASHTLTYSEVSRLTESDVEVIKEVLNTAGQVSPDLAEKLKERTKAVLEQKLGVKTEQSTQAFLETLIKDYNAYHGRLA